jgi:hypothetical protein
MLIADIVGRGDCPGAVSTRRHQTVELRLAETGAELRPAVEAAQYARVISFEPPKRADRGQAIARFVEAFTACTETWEALEPMARPGALAGLGARLDALQRCDLFVHWAALERGIAGSGGSVRMPIAVLTISETDLPTARLQLPGELEVDLRRGTTRH